MRRFILGWKVLGHARRFGAEIVNYADDFCVLGKAPAAAMLAAVNRLMERLKLPVNARTTRCLRCPEELLKLAERLCVEHSPLLVPGTHFGLEGTFRIGFGLPEEELTPALERVGELLRELD